MSHSVLSSVASTSRRGRGPLDWIIAKMMARVVAGTLVVRTPRGVTRSAVGKLPGPAVSIDLHRGRAVWRLLLAGDIGFAEAYMDGDWSTPDLPALLEFGALNQDAIGVDGSRAARVLQRLWHRASANTRAGSRRNIRAHYDIGNQFYTTWLDRGMTYSAAIYADPAQSLEQAQDEKLARIIDLLALRGSERVLEIGCGWGSLAERITARGCHLTGLTLSREQHDYALARLTSAGMADRADMRLQDYRDTEGRFDRIVSIEMLEAVGAEYWPAYFACIRDRLAAGGHAVLQFISIAEDRFAAYRDGADFIQRHIFPGGMLPSVPAMQVEATRAGLVMETAVTFAPGYAATLAAWRRRFLGAWPTLCEQGFDERFRRKWEYYLAYCEAGFRTGILDVGLYVVRAQE